MQRRARPLEIATRPKARSGGKGAPPRSAVGRTEATRHHILGSAVETIRDLGYYRASSNEIARRAGVTWGAIQHHFGTREALLLAVLDWTIDRVIADFAAVTIEGRSLEQRLGQLWDMHFGFFGQSGYLAILQILLDLSRDPAFGDRAKAAVDRYYDLYVEELARLSPQVWGDKPGGADDTALFVDVVGGLAIGHLVREAAGNRTRHAADTILRYRDTIIKQFAARSRPR